jgi:SAM-dependent methyltransferase
VTPSGAGFRDYFSERAAEYARFRPRYPARLFEALVRLAPGRGLAWDCGTGNGQAAVGLADHFRRVVATDASLQQLAHAERHPRVAYVRSLETRSGLAAARVDLVTVAQALHWFDLEPFFAEVGRVLRPGAAIAVWCYDLARVTPEIDALVDRFAQETVGPHWTPERRHVRAGYQDLPFPFQERPFPPCTMEREVTLDQFAGYLDTWSPVRRYRQAVGTDPLPPLIAVMAPLWGDPGVPRALRWPLKGRVGTVGQRGR